MLACAAVRGRVWRVGLPGVTAFFCTLSNAQPSWGPGSCQELQGSPSCAAWPCSSEFMLARGGGSFTGSGQGRAWYGRRMAKLCGAGVGPSGRAVGPR